MVILNYFLFVPNSYHCVNLATILSNFSYYIWIKSENFTDRIENDVICTQNQGPIIYFYDNFL